jgi:four helix bundle protein
MSAELKQRTKRFALEAFCFCADFRRIDGVHHIVDQLRRSSTSVAANYRAACRGKSTADFIAKLGTVIEEADESAFWLEFIKDLSVLRNFKLQGEISIELDRLWDEANQLVAIMVSCRKTARMNKK